MSFCSKYRPLDLFFFFIFIFVLCLPSTALLQSTRGTATGDSSLWISLPSRNSDLTEDELIISTKNTIVSESLTRQLFLSSVCSRSVSALAVFTNIPPSATAMEPNKNGESGNGSIVTIVPPSKIRARVLSMTLRSLPVSGCWAVAVTVSQTLESDVDSDFYTYLAVVDTGSPFLTAPMGALTKTNDIAPHTITKKKREQTKQKTSVANNSESNVSYEQYGTTIGSVQWKMAPYLTLIGNGDVENIKSSIGNSRNEGDSLDGRSHSVAADSNILLETEIEPIIIQDQTDVVLGIPSDEVVEETGGIFFGLMTIDAARPTPLQQLGYNAFVMRFRDKDSESPNDRRGRIRRMKDTTESENRARLILWDGKQSDDTKERQSMMSSSLIDRLDPYSMKLFDLTPYGPNLHHYGVMCDRFECQWGGDEEVDVVSFDCKLASGINSCASDRASLPGISLSRPLVAVFDTGLSGCIFSDTLWEEIQLERRRLKRHRKNRERGGGRSMDGFDDTRSSGSNSEESPPIGCTVWLPTIGGMETSSNAMHASQPSPSPPSAVKLTSISNYWRFQSFRLPWWYDTKDIAEDDDGAKNVGDGTSTTTTRTSKARNRNYPHVVVLGSTFWRNPNVLELAVDTTSERAKITSLPH